MVCTVPLRAVVAVIVVVMAGGMVALTFVAAASASRSVEEVTLGMVGQIAQRAVENTHVIIDTPFRGLNTMLNAVHSDMINLERWDAADYASISTFKEHIMESIPGWGSNLFTANEYGHIHASYGKQTDGRYMMGSAPPVDQIVRGVPSWAIPCMYQSNCTDPSNALNHQYCVNQSDPWVPYGGVVPTWARGGGTVGPPSLAAAFTPLDPPYATWAVPQNPNAIDLTYCRPNAQGPKPPCPGGAGEVCPEFNASIHTYLRGEYDNMTYTRSVPYDPRWYAWFVKTRNLLPGEKFISDTFICATTNGMCISATVPHHVTVPVVGATVTSNGRTGVVQGYVHTESEMHTPQVRMHDGGTEVIRRRQLSLLCTDTETCEAVGVANVSAQNTTLKFVGVIASAFYLDALTQIGTTFEVGKTGGVFLGDFTDGALLLTTGFPCAALANANGSGSCLEKRNSQGGTDRVSAFDPYAGDIVSGVMHEMFHAVQDPKTGRWIAEEHKHMADVSNGTVHFGGSSYWVEFRRIRSKDVKNVNWWVCVVVPHDDYLEQIRQNQVESLIVSLGLMAGLLALLLALAVVFFLRPVSVLIADFESACSMNLEDISNDHSGVVTEIRVLQDSFGVLVANLWIYRPFLPHSCFGPIGIMSPLSNLSSPANSQFSVGGSDCSHSSASSGKHGMTLREQLSAGLRKKNVTIMATNVNGFSLVAAEVPVLSELTSMHAILLTSLLQATAPKGVAEAFSGDRMVFSFNALGNQASTDAPFSSALRVSKMQFGKCSIHVGLSSSEVMCGTIGMESMKKFSVIGPCYGASIVLMTLNKHYAMINASDSKSHILMDQRITERAHSYNFKTKFIDVLMLPKLSSNRVQLWYLMGQSPVDCTEWMYALTEHEGSDMEWMDYLAGRVQDYTCGRIVDLVGAGVLGTEYVGDDPGYAHLCG